MSANITIAADTIISQSSSQIGCELDCETVLMHIDTGEYFGCDGIASRVWKLIERPQSVRELCETLVQEFDVDRQQCEQEITAFLSELASETLIDVSAAA